MSALVEDQVEALNEAALGTGKSTKCHYVALDPVTGAPSGECLCGYKWDRVFVKHSGEICQECVDVSRRLAQKA